MLRLSNMQTASTDICIHTCTRSRGTRYKNSGFCGLTSRRLSVGTSAKAMAAPVSTMPSSNRRWSSPAKHTLSNRFDKANAGHSLSGTQAQYLYSSCSTPLLRRFLASLTGAASREEVDLSQPVALNLLCCTPGLCQPPPPKTGMAGMEYEHGPRALEGTQAPQVASVNPPSNNLLYNILLSKHLRVSDL